MLSIHCMGLVYLRQRRKNKHLGAIPIKDLVLI
jgi:hypothetical protein